MPAMPPSRYADNSERVQSPLRVEVNAALVAFSLFSALCAALISGNGELLGLPQAIRSPVALAFWILAIVDLALIRGLGPAERAGSESPATPFRQPRQK